MDEIAVNFSEEVWKDKLNTFYNGFIRNNINAIAHTISNNHKELTSDISHLKD